MRRLLWLLVPAAFCTVVVFTDHYTNSRLGTNDVETAITPTNTAAAQFGKSCTYSTDGGVYSQPIFIPAVSGVTGYSVPVNLLIVSTQNGSLYAFNADKCGTAIWTVNFGAVQAAGSYPGSMGSLIYDRQNGCKGTPAVDTVNGVVYVVCSTATNWVLHRRKLQTGGTYAGPPGLGTDNQTITATVNSVTFCPLCQQNSAGVTLANGNVYVSFGSMSDGTNHGNWYGWVMSYGTDVNMNQLAAFCTTCGNASGGGGIWQSGGGLSVDDSGNLYAITGNGSGTPAVGNLCLSVIKLDSSLNVLDWYAPTDYSTYNSRDWDMSAGRPMLIPSTNLLVFGSKDFNVYSINRTCMGNIGGAQNGCTAPQVFATGTQGAITDHQGIYGCLYVPGLHRAYFPNTNGNVYGFSLSGSTWNTTPTVSANTYEFPGSQMVASCNGSTNCVIFGTMPIASSSLFSAQPAKLVAFNPSTLAEIYSSTGRTTDAVGTLAKLTVPTVANGRVYVGTLDNTVVVYSPNLTNRMIIAN